MSLYYPQAAVTLRIYWEDFGKPSSVLEKEMVVDGVIPKNVEVEINSINEADTFKMELDYKTFPFDPRTIRALGVTIHMEDVEKVFDERGVQAKIEPSVDNQIFIGFADENKINFNADSRTVSIEGRDYTALLIDQKYFGKAPDLSKPLDAVIKELIDSVSGAESISVKNETGSPLILPSSIISSLTTLSGKKNTRKNSTVWDVIQEILRRLGYKGFVSGDSFVIQIPKNVYSGRKGFTQFVYGLNLSSLEFKRKIGRFRGTNIKVTGLSIEDKEVVTAEIPREATDVDLLKRFGGKDITVKKLGADGKPLPDQKAEFITFPVSNVRDKNHLIKIGEQIFYEYSRQQLEGTLETKEMLLPERVFNDGRSTDKIRKVEFRKIKNGTPIEIFMSVDDMKEISQLSTIADKKKYLVNKFYRPDVAEALARSMNRISTPFIVNNATFRLDNENGFSMSVDFLNIIDVNNGNVDI